MGRDQWVALVLSILSVVFITGVFAWEKIKQRFLWKRHPKKKR